MPSRKIKVLTVTDLHLHKALYDQLIEAVAEHAPDVVACVGDFLNDEEIASTQDSPTLSPEAAANALTGLPCEVVFTRGNHELDLWDRFETTWLSSGKKLNALHGTAFTYGPLVMVGFPCWMGLDEHYAKNRPLDRYFPDEWLDPLMVEAGPAGRTLWLLHEPPSPDISSFESYEAMWCEAVESHQPLLTISGHDHQTPIRTGKWKTKLGNSVCVNAGQRPKELIYCLIDFEFDVTIPSLPITFGVRRIV